MRWVTGTTAPLIVESPPGESWIDYVHGMDWEDSVHGVQGQLAWGVVLGLTPEDFQGEISLCTVDQVAFAEFNASSESSERVELALSGLFALLNRTSPAMAEVERRQYLGALADFADCEATTVVTWPELKWSISGTTRTVRIYWFAGAWLVLAEDPMFFALGDGIRPEGITLSTDLPPEIASALAAGVDVDWLNTHRDTEPRHTGFELPRAIHEDHYRVLRFGGAGS